MKNTGDRVQLMLVLIFGGVLGSIVVLLIFPGDELGLADFRLAFAGGVGVSYLIIYVFKRLRKK